MKRSLGCALIVLAIGMLSSAVKASSVTGTVSSLQVGGCTGLGLTGGACLTIAGIKSGSDPCSTSGYWFNPDSSSAENTLLRMLFKAKAEGLQVTVQGTGDCGGTPFERIDNVQF